MPKKLLIDARQSDETRVVLLNNNKLEDFDYETSHRKQLKGNIYLARVTRVEPSLQAAFVEYGGNRQGFLAFSEIHPDYYRIPIEDREKLLAEEEERAAKADQDDADDAAETTVAENVREESISAPAEGASDDAVNEDGASIDAAEANAEEANGDDASVDDASTDDKNAEDANTVDASVDDAAATAEGDGDNDGDGEGDDAADEEHDAREERRRQSRISRHYKIQEVISRRQILLIQVVKEERGNKGAALTTYLSLAGRYCVLMPNTYHGGGVSRKISNPADRKKLKTIVNGLDVPKGMAVIVRTAGSKRTKAEITRDFTYLTRQWDDIRNLTMESSAPALIHEEGNLVKRSIRDYYGADVEEVIVEGEDAYKAAKTHMKNLMPSHVKKVTSYEDKALPLFQRYQVEAMLSAMHEPQVVLKSGGYLVINQTEALVAIDVNSGRATKERNIEETALKTNLEAAEEIAQQLRQRDLSGLVVIDFIDMENNRNQNAVERKLKEALRNDRARIQVGGISQFGLLEMSRQRLRPSLAESVTNTCPHCNGTGRVRSVESASLQVLRGIETEALKEKGEDLKVFMNAEIALYILNHKRDILMAIEQRFGIAISLEQDNSLITPDIRIGDEVSTSQSRQEHNNNRDGGGRRRRGGGGRDKAQSENNQRDATPQDKNTAASENTPANPEAGGEDDEDKPRRRRRRGKRGGRRRGRRDGQDNAENQNADGNQEQTDQATGDAAQTGAAEDKPSSSRGKSNARASSNAPVEASADAAATTAEKAPEKAAEKTSAEAADGKDKPAAKKAKKAKKASKKAAKAKAKKSADGDAPEATVKKAPKAKKAKKASKKAAATDAAASPAVKEKASAPRAATSSSPVNVVDVNDAKPATKKKGWWS